MKKITYQAWYSCGVFFKSFGEETNNIMEAIREARNNNANSIIIRTYKKLNKHIVIVDDVEVLNIPEE